MAERSARLMAKAESSDVSLYVSLLVLAEVIWVLKSFYRYPMTAIAHVIIALVSAPGIEIDNRELIIRAVELAPTGMSISPMPTWSFRQQGMVRRSAPSTRAISGGYRSNGWLPNDSLPRFPQSAIPPKYSSTRRPGAVISTPMPS